MNKAINFYELKEELARLGFREPEVTDSLRQAVFTDADEQRLFTNIGKVAFDIDLIRDESTRLSFVGYLGSLGAGTDKWQLQSFQPEVPAPAAAELLMLRAEQVGPTEDLPFIPLDLAGVKKETDFLTSMQSHDMDALAEKGVMEQFAGFVEEAREIGWNWITYEDHNGHIKNDSWQGFRSYEAAAEQREIGLPYTNLANAEDLLPQLYQRIDGQVKPGSPEQVIEGLISAGFQHWADPEEYELLASPHGPFYHVDEYEIRGRRVVTELELGGNNHSLTFKQLTAYLLPKAFTEEVDIIPAFPLKDCLPVDTISQTFTQLEPLNRIYEQLKNQNQMNTQNLEFLKNTLLNIGFGDKVNKELEQQISKKTPEFTLNARHEFNQRPIDYTLHFKAGDTDAMYFFNKFDATLRKGKEQELNQTFYINKGNGITAKEAFNLMEGRAIHKQLFNREGEKYHAWLQLDQQKTTDGGNKEIKRFNENYGFDLEKVLTGKGIKEMENADTKESLLRSIKKGNAQQITVTRNKEDVKYFVAASPQFKTIDLYDHQMKKIQREELLQPTQKKAASQKQGKQQKETLPEKKQSSRKRKMGV